jgi:hypothetical protein
MFGFLKRIRNLHAIVDTLQKENDELRSRLSAMTEDRNVWRSAANQSASIVSSVRAALGGGDASWSERKVAS